MSIIACDTSASKKEFLDGKTQLEKELSLSNTQKVSKLYFIGGFDGSRRKNDVWSSTNGKDWTELTSDGEFSARDGHQVVIFQGKMYLIGGYDFIDITIPKNDVWSSSDGKNWEQETANAKFSARNGHQVVLFNDRMYLIGGYDGGYKNDVWSSTNGKDWTELTSDAEFSARSRHQVVLFQGKLYLIGGSDDDGYKNDVWSSTNGKDWEEVRTDGDVFSKRFEHQVVLFQDKLYLVGGRAYDGYKNDVWSSTNGKDWTELTSDGEKFSVREGHQLVVFRNKMYLIGGLEMDSSGYRKTTNDVWSSEDGVRWKQEIAYATFSLRSGHQVVVFLAEAQ